MLKLSYFITNIFFVVSLICTLFVHRAVVSTKAKELVAETVVKLNRLKLYRVLLIFVTVAFFISMCVSFIADMKVNG